MKMPPGPQKIIRHVNNLRGILAFLLLLPLMLTLYWITKIYQYQQKNK